MNRLTVFFISAAALLAAGCKTDTNPVLDIEGGRIQGVLTDTKGVTVYRGIPYAAAPTGENRWKEPQAVTPWDGVKVADKFSAASYQAKHDKTNAYTSEFFYEGDPEFSEDCLYLNVWTPAPGKIDEKLPVAMWIHGGAYTGGWGFEREMDGEAWAERGVVLVTINYRLGIFGFLSHPLLSAESPYGASGNYGILDQIAALKWIYNNIEQFGGDPDNITILGQSAGAGSVMNLVASPLTGDMIKKAIIMSGGGISRAPVADPTAGNAALAQNAKTLFDWAGFDTVEKMREASTEIVFGLPASYASQNGAPLRITTSPIVDNYMATESFSSAALNGRIKNIPYMIGSVRDDLGSLGAGISNFCNLREDAGLPAFAYQFARPLPENDPDHHDLHGAFHSSELWYVFHTLKNSDRPFTEVDDELSQQMVDAWTNFVKNGNPNGGRVENWTPLTRENPEYMIFKLNDDASAVASAMGDMLPSQRQ